MRKSIKWNSRFLFFIALFFLFLFLPAKTLAAEPDPVDNPPVSETADPANPQQNTDAMENTDPAQGTEAEDQKALEEGDHGKSKEATNLDDDYKSDVTLSLPALEEKLETEVVFVLDKSTYSDTKDAALKVLENLKDQVKKTDAKVKVAVVHFNRAAHSDGFHDLVSEYDAIHEQFVMKFSGGTNMHAGLLKAKELLEADSSIPNSRKYFVLVSDGDTYLFCPDGDYNKYYSRGYVPVDKQGKAGYAWGGYYEEGYYVASGRYGNAPRPKTTDAESWETYFADVEKRNAESNGDQYNFEWKYYDEKWSSNKDLARQTYVETPRQPNTASNMDMAFYYASKVYHELAAKYHGYSYSAKNLASTGGHPAFMQYLNGGANANFEEIQNELIYFLGKGSRVEDFMGYKEGDYNFDLVDLDKMTVDFEGASTNGKVITYKAEKIGENRYGFGKVESGYLYEVVYTPDKNDKEKLTWILNHNLTNFDRVSLHYTVQLMNPKSEPGTYGKYDKDGSKKLDGLFTNNSAILYPISSTGEELDPEAFQKPTVSYKVEEPKTPEKEDTPKPEKNEVSVQPSANGTVTTGVFSSTAMYMVTLSLAGLGVLFMGKRNH